MDGGEFGLDLPGQRVSNYSYRLVTRAKMALLILKCMILKLKGHFSLRPNIILENLTIRLHMPRTKFESNTMVKLYFSTVSLLLIKGTIRLAFAKDICIVAWTLSQTAMLNAMIHAFVI